MKGSLEIIADWEDTTGVLHNKLEKNSAIYKWVIGKAIYIGETVNLAKRIRGYIRPGPTQTTNKRINSFIEKAKTVEFYVLNISSLKINETEIINSSNQDEVLKDVFIRKLIENYYLVQAKLEGVELLNAVGRKG